MDLLKDYVSFVDEVTSDQSKDLVEMVQALEILEEQGVNPARLLTAGIGMAGECGEFNEIIKKCLFQGKEMDIDKIKHLRSELGDVMWYIAQACLALNTNIEEIIDMNTVKLESRYPGGFDAFRSENRKEGDI
jgi:NTP pyrophosphatase (non-canonical NTP hydrolase)|tara:strand:- start:1856 stop:2254 length:399 start_codon:yes stop_codon:yes gene_type:complete